MAFPDGRDKGTPVLINRVFLGIITLVVIIVASIFAGNLFESIDANEIAVFQEVPSGKLVVYKTPGWKWQGFAKVTKYHKRVQFWFSSQKDQGDKTDQSIKVRFNDGGHANVSGSFAWEMPLADSAVISLHTKYGSEEGIAHQMIRTSAERAFYMTGPLMSSTESYAVRRPDLLSFMEDQLQRGVYKTRKIDMKAPDPITGEEKTVSVVQIVTDDKGVPLRQENSPLGEFGIRTFNLSLNEIKYDEAVENQIKTQQQMAMQVQTAIAEAKQSEQRRITVEQNGMADAAKAKWDQEVIKAKEVTAAQQRLAVAELDARAMEQTKRKLILEGEGEGAKRRAIIAGDNALDSRLKIWLEGQKVWATAFQNYQGKVVPDVVMGATGTNYGGGNNGMQQAMEVIGVKMARDLAVEMQMGKDKK